MVKNAILILGLISMGLTGLASTANAEGLRAFLGLTPQQGTALGTLRLQLEETVKPLKLEVAIRERAIAEALDEEPLDVLYIGGLAVQIDAIRGQIHIAAARVRERAVGLLNDEQQGRLDPLRLSATLAPIAKQALELNLIVPFASP